MAGCSVPAMEDELSDENCTKSLLFNSVCEDDGVKRKCRGAQELSISKKSSSKEVKPGEGADSSKANDALLNISDVELESLLQEAANPLYCKSSNNPLLQKVIDETNFDEPYLAAEKTSSFGKLSSGYRESRRQLERRLRLECACAAAVTTTTAASRTTQGGSLQNLHNKTEGKKLLRKSGSLNIFPQGCSDDRAVFNKSSVCAHNSVVPKLSRLTSLRGRQRTTSATACHLVDSIVSLPCVATEEVCGRNFRGHRRNRSLSECQSSDLSAAEATACPPPAPLRKRSVGADFAGLSSSSAVAATQVASSSPSIVNDDPDCSEEVEMMDVDHSNEDMKIETFPLLKVDTSNGVVWSCGGQQTTAAVEVSAARPTAVEADDRVDFPLTRNYSRIEDEQENEQTGLTKFHKTFSLVDRTGVIGLMRSDGSEEHVLGSNAHIVGRKIGSRTENDDLKSSGYQRSLDENGNPLIHQDFGSIVRNSSCFRPDFLSRGQQQQLLHREMDVSFGGDAYQKKKYKKIKQISKQKGLLAEQIEGHFGSLDIEVIMKKINSGLDQDTNDSLAKRLSHNTKDGNREMSLKMKKANKDNNRKNLENGLVSVNHKVTERGVVDSDDCQRVPASANSLPAKEKPSKVRKQEFQKRGPNDSSDGSGSQQTSFESDGGGQVHGKTSEQNADGSKFHSSCKDQKESVVNAADHYGDKSLDQSAKASKEMSSFVSDFYAVTELQEITTAEEDLEFREVRTKKKKKKKSQGSVLSSTAKTGDVVGVRFNSTDRCGIQDSRFRYGGGAASAFRAGGTRSVADGALWSDLPPLSHRHRNQLVAVDDIRRKSMGSVPPSEHSSVDNSDVESVHSLPVSSTTPKEAVCKTSSSSSCTPQASYADITKMPSCQGAAHGRAALFASSSSSGRLSPQDQRPDAKTNSFADISIDTDLSSDAVACISGPNDAPSTVGTEPTETNDGRVMSDSVCDQCSAEALMSSLAVPDAAGDAPVPCASESVAPSVCVAQQRPPPTSRVAAPRTKAAVKSRHSVSTSRQRPVVVFVGDLGEPARFDEITFGFEVNEQLLKGLEPPPSLSSCEGGGHSESGAQRLRFTTCADDDDSIIATGRITGAVAADERHSETTRPVADYNYKVVVDFLGVAWTGVQKELEEETDKRSNVNRPAANIQYYKPE